MTRSAARPTVAAAGPEYWCDRCSSFHSGPCPAAAHRQLGVLLARMVREADARVPEGRRARRTLQEMAPGYQRQPVLTLHRSVMAEACPLCLRWNCKGSDCPPSGAAPAPTAPTASAVPVVTGGGWQCDQCGGWFGVTAELPAPASVRPAPVTAWTCSACSALR
ncbi:hypothetical protein AB0N88_37425 [Streptomyces sp. NPDC093516]|uniref:hypothetical protein n=1 Tax=Streptomyces sp. NPDC093516 TaxID=3155304 RepID=UPI003447ACEB